MTEPSIHDKIKKMISDEVLVGVSVDDIGDDASLISDLNLDSIQMLSLITGLETEFNIMLDEEDLDLENLSSVNKLAEFVQKKLA
jgi:acyl carrier protein